MDCSQWMYLSVRRVWLAWHRRRADGRQDHCQHGDSEVNTHAEHSVVTTAMWAMMHGVSATTPIPFMVAERWILSRARQPVDQRYRRSELSLRPAMAWRQRRWRDVCRKEKMKIEILGRRRSRNGKSRSDDAMLKYIENYRSSGLLAGPRRRLSSRSVSAWFGFA
mmetsp:Transcript_79380/g.257145  ORF Transcript_79380/g.257145 Transcript_79380/m.257145 type:complete len:165 (+) Transcript_79380:84-578(+)